MAWRDRQIVRVIAPTIFVAIAVTGGHEVDFRPPRNPKRTKAKPGTQGKVNVLACRVLRGEELWSSSDSARSLN
jgi:hypothetical protein